MGHIRSGTVEKFKEAFDKALKGGEGFYAASHRCEQTFMNLFDEGCSGKPLFDNELVNIHGFIVSLLIPCPKNMMISQLLFGRLPFGHQ